MVVVATAVVVAAVVVAAMVVVAVAVVVAADAVTKPSGDSIYPNRGEVMLTVAEQAVLKVFRQFLMRQGEMLCFQGPLWEKHKGSLRQLTERDMLFQESFKGAYSLTKSGYAAMKSISAA